MASAAARSAAGAASTVAKLDFSSLVKGVPDVTKLAKMNDLAKIDPNFAKQLDGLTDAQKLSKFDELADVGAKAKKSNFLADNASTLLTGGVVAGGLLYLDEQYASAEEDVKDCMKVCLPGNWDDYAYGDLDQNELQYKELDDAGDQPVCTAQMPDCGKYCGDKCEEIHDYDAPGSNLLTGAGGDAGELAGGLFGGLLGGLGGGLADGLGVDTGVVSASSSSLSLCCCILVITAAVMSA
tara:strand:+ start:1036 stop:1752 length:717 start_codon:yes stop_codon:yes gene_type:complete